MDENRRTCLLIGNSKRQVIEGPKGVGVALGPLKGHGRKQRFVELPGDRG